MVIKKMDGYNGVECMYFIDGILRENYFIKQTLELVVKPEVIPEPEPKTAILIKS